jgi:hypothetical protein
MQIAQHMTALLLLIPSLVDEFYGPTIGWYVSYNTYHGYLMTVDCWPCIRYLGMPFPMLSKPVLPLWLCDPIIPTLIMDAHGISVGTN